MACSGGAAGWAEEAALVSDSVSPNHNQGRGDAAVGSRSRHSADPAGGEMIAAACELGAGGAGRSDGPGLASCGRTYSPR